MLYALARFLLKIARWFWLVLLLAIVVGTIANILVLKPGEFSQSIVVKLYWWFLQLEWYQKALAGLPVGITLLAWIFTMVEDYKRGSKDLKEYLRAMLIKYQKLTPVGFAQQTAMLTVSVSLDDIFIHLKAITAQPRYDIPTEQMKLYEELRHRSDLTDEQREEQIQALRVVWYTQMGRESLEKNQPAHASIEEMLEQLTAQHPGAVILGGPGSGKSTTLRWFAYHMARAFRLPWYYQWLNTFVSFLNRLTHAEFAWGYNLPKRLAPKQIPILIRISDYADAIQKHEGGRLPLETFLLEYFGTEYHHSGKLGNRLLHELRNGRCLVLLDGLDEVASDELRRRITENICTFIAANSSEDTTNRCYNRFIITSRIVGYEKRDFVNYTHHTLRDLEDEQMKQFLTSWCPAVERHLMMLSPGKEKLTSQEEAQAYKNGIAQRDRLLETLQNSPGIKQLATNPLTLTLLALLQLSGKKLPHRRIELYEIVTRTLLIYWNDGTGRKIVLPDQIPLAEDLLGRLAYEMHSSDLLLTKAKVKEITGQSMRDFYRRSPGEYEIDQFVEKIRSSSGLFVEVGQGIFGFMHRTFEEYYVVTYLFRKPFVELQQFFQDHWYTPTWHESLILLISYKNGLSKDNEKREVTDLISLVANAESNCDRILHRNLLFAARCIIGCNAWTLDHSLQHTIAKSLFKIYGSPLTIGRYTQLQKNIEQIALLWLQGQSLEDSDTKRPLLEAWSNALSDASNSILQEGATHLLASIAIDLINCPKHVISIFLPPLIQLAGLQDLPCPAELRTKVSQVQARATSRTVTEYAATALRFLDAEGPAGWLHKEWLQWSQAQPVLLECLTQHSLELDYLLTPVAFPARSENPHWQQRIDISNNWQERGRDSAVQLQIELLCTNDVACFPYAYLYKRALDAELASPSTHWYDVWEDFLKQEMTCSTGVIYQACLHLRLLLYQKDSEKRQRVAKELMRTLVTDNQQQSQALVVIANMFWKEIRAPHFLQEFYEPWLRELQYLLDIREVLDIQHIFLHYLQQLRERRNLRYLREQYYLPLLKKLLDLNAVRKMWELRNVQHVFKLLDLREWLDCESILKHFCLVLKHNVDENSTTILVTLYSILEITPFTQSLFQTIWESIQKFEQQATRKGLLTREHRLLIERIGQLLGANEVAHITITSSLHQESPDDTLSSISSLIEQGKLSDELIKKILRASVDTRSLSRKKQDALYINTSRYLDTVQAATWELLHQPFTVKVEDISLLLYYIESNNIMLCAACALLAQQSKKRLSINQRNQIAEKIVGALERDISSYHLLQPFDAIETWRLDDVLFEALDVLIA